MPQTKQTFTEEESSYRADRPIQSKADDRFNRWPFARRLADTIARRADASSLVIGIYGIWGDGKTSVLHLMAEALKEHQQVILVRFNPWHFQSESHLLRGFFATLAEALDTSLTTKKEKIGTILKEYGSLLSLGSIIIGDAGEGLSRFGEALSTVELDELRRRVETFLQEARKRVVVLIDDIDRLDRQEIQTIFKLVKLSADFAFITYVLAFDDEIVADALGEKYGQGGAEAGRNFLEKIIQVPLHLPPADKLSLRGITLEGVDAALRLSGIQLTEEQAQAFVRYFVDGLEPRLVTPRQAKRYANALTFALPLLIGEAHPVDQMLVEGIRVFYPKLYTVIRGNPDVFLRKGGDRHETAENRKQAQEIIETGLKGLDATEQKAATNLLQVLFPRLKSVYDHINYGYEWDKRWAREQRICSERYFHRYFHYAAPRGDVPDQAVERLLQAAAATNEEEVRLLLVDLAGNGGAALLIEKLRIRADELDAETAKTLATAIARNGAHFPSDDPIMTFAATFSQAAMLERQLVERLRKGEARDSFACHLMLEAEPLPFAVECLRWLRRSQDKLESEQVVSLETEQKLGQCLADRIRIAASQQPPYVEYSDKSHALLWVWQTYGSTGEVAAYLEARFAVDPSEATKFLISFVPKAMEMETGLIHKSDFERDAYDAVARLIDPELLFSHITALYSLQPQLNESVFYSDGPFEERIAQQFAYIHQQAKATLSVSDTAQGAAAPGEGQ